MEEKAAAEKFPLGIADDIPQPRSVTYTDYDDPFSLQHNASGSPHIATLSTNAWVGCGDDIYVLECLGKGHIRIEPAKEDERKFFERCKHTIASRNPSQRANRTFKRGLRQHHWTERQLRRLGYLLSSARERLLPHQR